MKGEKDSTCVLQGSEMHTADEYDKIIYAVEKITRSESNIDDTGGFHK